MSTPSKKDLAVRVPLARDSVWVGVAFWLILFLATGLFSTVLLAPKWSRTELLRDRVAELSVEIERLNETNDRMGRLLEAFRHDPDFDRELARLELDYAQAGEQRLGEPPPADSPAMAGRPALRRTEWWRPVVQIFTHDPSVRRAALGTAALLLVVGLACFNSPRQEP